MRSGVSGAACAAFFLAGAQIGFAQTPEIIERFSPYLPPGTVSSFIYGLSADGLKYAGLLSSGGITSGAFWNGASVTAFGAGSAVFGISADGSTVVGYGSFGGGVSWRAFRHKNNTIDVISPVGVEAVAYAVSGDGNVVVGDYDNLGVLRAFRWVEGVGFQDIGPLGVGNTGAKGVSHDGKVVVGFSEIGLSSMAFRWVEGVGMTGLGTLRSDNAGSSYAAGVSSNGNVVVGYATTDTWNTRAFRWIDGVGMQDLGALMPGGDSWAWGVSSNGRFVVGSATIATPLGGPQAFIWGEEFGMLGLGTLKSDNSGISEARGVTDDGTVVVGVSDTDLGLTHAAIWKLKYSGTVVAVDATNSVYAMGRTASRGYGVLDLYQTALSSLSEARCDVSAGGACVGVFTTYDATNGNGRATTGAFGAFRLSDNVVIGGAVNVPYHTDLVENYEARGDLRPGVGAFIRFEQERDGRGLSLTLSGSYLSQGVSIWRDTLPMTEPGKGRSTIEGHRVAVTAAYGFGLGEKTSITSQVSLSHHKVTRDAYTETSGAEFPATYGKLGNERTDLDVGLNVRHKLSDLFEFDVTAGASIKLMNNRKEFTGAIPYIGAFAYDRGPGDDMNPYAGLGVNVNLAANSVLRAAVAWQRNDYNNDGFRTALSYAYRW